MPKTERAEDLRYVGASWPRGGGELMEWEMFCLRSSTCQRERDGVVVFTTAGTVGKTVLTTYAGVFLWGCASGV